MVAYYDHPHYDTTPVGGYTIHSNMVRVWTVNTQTGTTGTASTYWYPIDSIRHTAVSNYPPPVALPPKNWRWYNVFRTWEKPKQLELKLIATKRIDRPQERLNLSQKRATKRRMFNQQLRA